MSNEIHAPPGWVSTTVEESLMLIDYRGRTPPYSSEGIPHLRSANVKNGRVIWENLKFVSEEAYDSFMTRGIPREDDLLLTTEAPLGEVALVPPVRFSLAQRLLILRPPSEINSRFLMYQIMCSQFQASLNLKGTGSTVTGISSRNFKSVPLLIAPYQEQYRIADKIEELFSDLDAGVAALERAKVNLKRYRAAVLKAAVEGKLTEQWRAENPDVEPASELLKQILTERRQRWEAEQLAKYEEKGKQPPAGWEKKYQEPAEPDVAGLPELPEGWCWATVDQMIQRSEYGTSVKCSYDADGFPVLRIPNIAQGEIDLSDVKFATKSLDIDKETRLNVGDLLMCRTNGSIRLIGKTAVIRSEFDVPHAFASYLLRFRFLIENSLALWIHLYCSSIDGRRFIEGNAASSAGQHNISLSLMNSMSLPLPPIAEISEINRAIENVFSQIEEAEKDCEKSLLRASRLRQSILKRAFEGKLVPQDPNDEPASVLLERIKAERVAADAAANGKRTKQRVQTK